MANLLERTYVIPLRKEFMKKPNYKKTKKAITAIKEFLMKHMKGDDVKLGAHLNEAIWANGRKNPPPRIKVKAIKDDKNIIRAELPEFEIITAKKEKTDKKSKKEEKLSSEEKADLSLQKNIKKAAKEQVKKTSEVKEENN